MEAQSRTSPRNVEQWVQNTKDNRGERINILDAHVSAEGKDKGKREEDARYLGQGIKVGSTHMGGLSDMDQKRKRAESSSFETNVVFMEEEPYAEVGSKNLQEAGLGMQARLDQ